jgi:hypothetical protein
MLNLQYSLVPQLPKENRCKHGYMESELTLVLDTDPLPGAYFSNCTNSYQTKSNPLL